VIGETHSQIYRGNNQKYNRSDELHSGSVTIYEGIFRGHSRILTIGHCLGASPIQKPNDHDDREEPKTKIKGKKRAMSQESN
jgi:hypothetical protein